jgi:purine-nucleoside phosphorylase
MATSHPRLDDTIFPSVAALDEAGVPQPDALLFLGTGLGVHLPGALSSPRRFELADLEGTPFAWREEVLHAGRLGRTRVWVLEDAPGGLEFGEGGDAPWEAAWPIWLASAAGAMVLVHTSAGSSLSAPGAPAARSLAVLTDHVNLSGSTPLAGLGETRLGPLFPDQTRVHSKALRALAARAARERGITLTEAIAACTVGPALSTPAELRWLATTGANVAVQRLADPILAAAHASLATLALVGVTDRGDEQLSMEELVARADQVAPALEDLVLAIAPELASVAERLRDEEGH